MRCGDGREGRGGSDVDGGSWGGSKRDNKSEDKSADSGNSEGEENGIESSRCLDPTSTSSDTTVIRIFMRISLREMPYAWKMHAGDLLLSCMTPS